MRFFPQLTVSNRLDDFTCSYTYQKYIKRFIETTPKEELTIVRSLCFLHPDWYFKMSPTAEFTGATGIEFWNPNGTFIRIFPKQQKYHNETSGCYVEIFCYGTHTYLSFKKVPKVLDKFLGICYNVDK